ncbi:type II secretion system F family protein [Gimesia maris]|uniref:Bacterial type II secretion system protein F domain protein n=1 Tax=Gimesia maris TaxID=122 RepID=A0ABX5YHU8_9PLAN|nr:type II secretion system F family protein [Gimesia maris]EDL60067.1 putative tight adherence tadb-related transmembrane protein [Gimesia maris DSM 8797]QDU13354.1 Bacterial type II secretion system protein F domain protein [Gimesia maris]QEG15281.1 Bacterial type II secretion system protein F domain protein [Gimesia maris]QGQ31394.1 pilus assembly protein TadB [Gimesia maris]
MATDAAVNTKNMENFSDILRDQDRYAVNDSKQLGNRLNGGFDELIIHSGLDANPGVILFLCLMTATLAGGLIFILQENFLSTSIAFMVGGMAPIGYLIFSRSRRQNKINDQLSDMIDELARAAKTGRSLTHCFINVAEKTPAPLGDELKEASRRLQMGVSMKAALDGLYERTGVASLNILSMALIVHQETGGDLVKVLERLARTIRDRVLFLGRLRTATAGSRATAVLMILLPPLILGFFILRDPTYLTTLMASSWGRGATFTAIALQVIGSLWVLRVLKTSQRS